MNYWTFRHRHRAGLLDCQRAQPLSVRDSRIRLWRRSSDQNAKAEAIAVGGGATTESLVWSVNFNQTVTPIGTFVQNTDLVGQGVPIDEELLPQHLKFLTLHDAFRRFLNIFYRYFRLEQTLELSNRLEVPPEDPGVELADLHIKLVACSIDRTFHVRSLS